MQISSLKTKLALIFSLAIFLRLAGISSRPIWYDEAFSILFSEKGISAMLYGTLQRVGNGIADIHPLGYYTLLWAWMKIFGQSVVTGRLLSVAISFASLILIYLIASYLFNEKTALVSILLVSILPFQVHFAQEIRMYSLLTFSLLLATFAFLRGRTMKWGWWVIFSISSAMAQYSHNLAAIYLIPLALTPFLQRDANNIKSISFASAFAIFLYFPWLVHLPAQFSKVNAYYWVERPGLEKAFTLLLFYLPNLPLPNQYLLPFLLISTTTVVFAVYQTILAIKKKMPGNEYGIWLAYLAFMPPLFLWLISQFVPVYIERALLPSHAIFCIWLAWAFTQTKMPRLIQVFAFILILISAGMGIYQHITYCGFPYISSVLNQSIKTRLKEGDIIIHSNKLTYLPSFYFNRELPQIYISDPVGSSIDTLSPATQKILHLNNQETIVTASKNAHRVWYIIQKQSLDEFISHGYETHPDIKYLNTNFTLTSTEDLNSIRLYLFTRRPP
jgi:uncharacterized membrane protein